MPISEVPNTVSHMLISIPGEWYSGACMPGELYAAPSMVNLCPTEAYLAVDQHAGSGRKWSCAVATGMGIEGKHAVDPECAHRHSEEYN